MNFHSFATPPLENLLLGRPLGPQANFQAECVYLSVLQQSHVVIFFILRISSKSFLQRMRVDGHCAKLPSPEFVCFDPQ